MAVGCRGTHRFPMKAIVQRLAAKEKGKTEAAEQEAVHA